MSIQKSFSKITLALLVTGLHLFAIEKTSVFAHSDNSFIQTQDVRNPQVAYAAVYDTNGDGYADFAGVKFTLSSVVDRYTISDARQIEESCPVSNFFSRVYPTKIIGNDSCIFVTRYQDGSGQGVVTLKFGNSTVPVTGILYDRVGPAIRSAVFFNDDVQRPSDTLEFIPSEPLMNVDKSNWNYLQFKSNNGLTSELLSLRVSWTSHGYRFEFPRESVVPFDSVRLIAGSGITDQVGNPPQQNSKFVAIQMPNVSILTSTKKIPSQKFLAVPNPVLAGTESVTLAVPETIRGKATCSIFDVQGNLLDEQEIVLGESKAIEWDLTNRAGVKVGSGTYVAILEATLPDGSVNQYKIIIGVQR